MIQKPVVAGIAILSLLIFFLLVTLIIKKAIRDLLHARKLWLKTRYAPLIEAFLANSPSRGLPLTAAEARSHQSIVEEILQELLGQLDGKKQRKVQELFARLGYLEFHLANLQSSNYLQRASSVEILGEMKSRKAVDPLIRLLQDPKEVVRHTSVRALGKIGGKKVVAALVEALRDGDRFVAARIAEALHLVGPVAVAPLIRLMQNAHPIAKASAAQVLGEIGDKRALRVLKKALLDDWPDVRAKAAVALGLIGDRKARSALENALKDTYWPVRSSAAKALGQLGDPASCYLLAKALVDSEWWVRTNAAQALTVLGTPGERTLVRMLSSIDRFARDKAAETLQLNGVIGKYISKLVSRDKSEYRRAYKPLSILARQGIVSPFEHALKESTDVELRCAIISFLGETGDEVAYEMISRHVDDRQRPVRETAKLALHRIQNRKWEAMGEGEDQRESGRLGA